VKINIENFEILFSQAYLPIYRSRYFVLLCKLKRFNYPYYFAAIQSMKF